MSSLYDLTEQFQELLSMALDPDVDEQALADTMEGIECEIEEKADGYAKVIKSMEADIPAIDAEIARLTARKNHRKKNRPRRRRTGRRRPKRRRRRRNRQNWKRPLSG